MDKRLLNFYNIELQHLREMAAEFAREFPKIAGRLALDREGREACADPFVERLLEGFAFLSARVQLKLDAEFPRFTQSILETVFPHYLSPCPSTAVVRFEPLTNIGLMEDAFVLPRETVMRSHPVNERTACEYRTAQAVDIWPIRVAEARYYTRDTGQLDLPHPLGARAAFRIRLQTTNGAPFKSLNLDRLSFFVRGADEVPISIFEQIFSRGLGVVIQPTSALREKARTVLPAGKIRRVGFREDEALLPNTPRGFQGYRFLQEYFTLPSRFLFFEISGMLQGVAQAEENQIDLIIPLKEPETRLENRVDASSFNLFCSPVINLFPHRADRIPVSNRFSEFQVIADRTRPLDYEVFSVGDVTGYDAGGAQEQHFKPFYLAKDSDPNSGAYFTVNRLPRVLTAKEKLFGATSSYTGTEIYLSIVDAMCAPYNPSIDQLGAQVMCTNRHLPSFMAVGMGDTDFSLLLNAPVKSVRCIHGPTSPRPPLADGAHSWRMISHLSLNYLSLLDLPGDEGAVALHDLLRLYADPADAYSKKQIAGIHSAQATPIVRRVETPGPIGFARGLEVSVLIDEDAFQGSGMFLLGSVLEQFFAKYVSLNSFTETVIRSKQRGDIIRWKPQVGRRQLI
jgi:type VI secretion system protein ImpG